jgi:hypothetical protein
VKDALTWIGIGALSFGLTYVMWLARGAVAFLGCVSGAVLLCIEYDLGVWPSLGIVGLAFVLGLKLSDIVGELALGKLIPIHSIMSWRR